jgi:hypothetical protein
MSSDRLAALLRLVEVRRREARAAVLAIRQRLDALDEAGRRPISVDLLEAGMAPYLDVTAALTRGANARRCGELRTGLEASRERALRARRDRRAVEILLERRKRAQILVDRARLRAEQEDAIARRAVQERLRSSP